MPEAAPPKVLPADVVQLIVPPYARALMIVEEVRSWGVTGHMQRVMTRDRIDEIPVRAKHGEFAVVGPLALAAKSLAEARDDYVATLDQSK